MDKFSPDAKCVKCGHDDINTLFRAKGEWLTGYKQLREDTMVRICMRCKFKWDEAPLDHSPSVKIDLAKPTEEEIETAKRMQGVRPSGGKRTVATVKPMTHGSCCDDSPSFELRDLSDDEFKREIESDRPRLERLMAETEEKWAKDIDDMPLARGKDGCEYCRDGSVMTNKSGSMSIHEGVIRTNTSYNTPLRSNEVAFDVDYCFNCGTKLEAE